MEQALSEIHAVTVTLVTGVQSMPPPCATPLDTIQGIISTLTQHGPITDEHDLETLVQIGACVDCLFEGLRVHDDLSPTSRLVRSPRVPSETAADAVDRFEPDVDSYPPISGLLATDDVAD
jgi:hypothetical protein